MTDVDVDEDVDVFVFDAEDNVDDFSIVAAALFCDELFVDIVELIVFDASVDVADEYGSVGDAGFLIEAFFSAFLR